MGKKLSGNAAENLAALRRLMEADGIDAYIVPTSDPHDSEYVHDYYGCRNWLTGFTGSAGTAVVTRDFAGLWTDGRYFVQAEKELNGSGFTLMRMLDPGVPTIREFLRDHLTTGQLLAFDGRTLSETAVETLENALPGIRVDGSFDLIGELWKDRPDLPWSPVWILEEKYAGISAVDKIAAVRDAMAEKGAGVHIITTLDDITWLFNIRGSDIPFTPVVYAYAMITAKDAILFSDRKKFSKEVRGYLAICGVELRDYDEIYPLIETLSGETVLMDRKRVNSRLWRSFAPDCEMVDAMNPTTVMKAVKNPVEIRNMTECHKEDAVAMIRFIRWLTENVGKEEITEYTAAEHLDRLRASLPGNLGPSFATISAYAENAAMCHYQADRDHAARLLPRGLYLVDSGGQYYTGTTDITRTFALGPVTDEEKKYYTLVLASHLRLLDTVFARGARGLTMDLAAREVFWKHGLDFNHGTGHGVGFLGSVHEGPNAFRFRVTEETLEPANAVFEPGMITSDEPGLYVEGVCGVRTESLLLCVEKETNAFGTFFGFTPLTLVPIDQTPIDTDYLSDEDIRVFNAYHRKVYEEIAPLLAGDEKDWLREATRELRRK